jgi:hypothetical protein
MITIPLVAGMHHSPLFVHRPFVKMIVYRLNRIFTNAFYPLSPPWDNNRDSKISSIKHRNEKEASPLVTNHLRVWRMRIVIKMTRSSSSWHKSEARLELLFIEHRHRYSPINPAKNHSWFFPLSCVYYLAYQSPQSSRKIALAQRNSP